MDPYEVTPQEFLNAFDQSDLTLYENEDEKSKFIAGNDYSTISTFTENATYKAETGTYTVDVEDYLADKKKRTVDQKAYDAACKETAKTIPITQFFIEKKLDVKIEY